MEPTHFLYLISPPRQNFPATMTAAEREIMSRHADYYWEHCAAGLVLMAGPVIDGTYGVSILNTTDPKVAEAFRDNDPAVTAGLMTPQLYPWRASIRQDTLE